MEARWKKGIVPPDKTFGGNTLAQQKEKGKLDKITPLPKKVELPDDLERKAENEGTIDEQGRLIGEDGELI